MYHMFLPSLTGRPEPGNTERELLSLPERYGGLGIINLSEVASKEFVASQHLKSSLVCTLIQQGTSSVDLARYPEQLSKEQLTRHRDTQLKDKATAVREQLPSSLQKAVDLAKEKGASNWLSALPLRKQTRF